MAAEACECPPPVHVVKGIKELVDAGIPGVPDRYVLPSARRPALSDVCHTEQMPVIDISGIEGQRRCHVIQDIATACTEWGFFQVINHGVSPSVMERIWAAARNFFEQPAQERMRYYSEDFSKEVSYVTSFNPSKETTLEWKDTLRLRCDHPGRFQGFKEAPSFCREPALDYLAEMRVLGARLYRAIFASAGLSYDYMDTTLPEIPAINISIHYYPSCPDPSLTFGLSGHSDFASLSILMQDEVGGLQVLKQGRWMAVNPVPNAFVVNVGDQIQILTNGKYKSVEHRVVTNPEKPRMSMATFFSPAPDTEISPLSELLDNSNPPVYRATLFGSYHSKCWQRRLEGKSNLEFSNKAAKP